MLVRTFPSEYLLIYIDTALALNDMVTHAFNDVIFNGLLLMTMDAVLHRVGHLNGSQQGSLYKPMPKTTIFCLVNAASICIDFYDTVYVSYRHKYCLSIALVMMLSTGCSNKAAYEMTQADKEQACERVAEGPAREDCIRHYKKSFDEYERQRNRAAGNK